MKKNFQLRVKGMQLTFPCRPVGNFPIPKVRQFTVEEWEIDPLSRVKNCNIGKYPGWDTPPPTTEPFLDQGRKMPAI
jgi:hypothetical protein